MEKNKCLRWYTKEFKLDYPEIVEELDLEILNSDTFLSINKTKFHIDMNDIEKEKNEVFFYQEEEEQNAIPQKEKVSLLNINYTSEEMLSYSLLCSLIEQKVYSFEGYVISSIAIVANSSYYSAWIYRRKCLKHLQLNLLNELKFTKYIISNNIKSFQSWFHRRWLIEYIYRWNRRTENTVTCTTQDTAKEVISNDMDFNDPSIFLSSDESEGSEGGEESNEDNYMGKTTEIVFNCEEKDFRIKKKQFILNEDLKNIIENYPFFKNAIKNNEKIDVNKLLYEELLYVNCDIFIDTKNYNSWAHKCWLIEHFQIFKNEELCKNYSIILNEFQLINFLLKDDIYNNSVWVYRYFIFSKMNYINNEEKLKKEILFCLNYAKTFSDNEAIFNYFIKIVFKYLKMREKEMLKRSVERNIDNATTKSRNADNQHIFDIPIIQHIQRDLKDLQTTSKFVLLFFAQLYSYDKSYDNEIECYKYLERHDHFNDHIWKQMIEETKQKKNCNDRK